MANEQPTNTSPTEEMEEKTPTNKPEKSEKSNKSEQSEKKADTPSVPEKFSAKEKHKNATPASSTSTEKTSQDITKTLTEKDKLLEEKNKALAEKDKQLAERNTTVEELTKQQSIATKKINEQEERLKALEQQLQKPEPMVNSSQPKNDIYINSSNENKPTSNVPKKKSTPKKSSNVSRNPLNRVVGTATSVVGGVGSFVHRRNAKMEEIGAEPSQLFTKSFWKNLGHNIKTVPKQIGKTLTAGFRKHDTPTTMINTQQSYTPSWSRSSTKGQPLYKRIPKAARWLARKPAKFFHRAEQVIENVMGDTFDAVKHTKISGNPKNWNFWRPSTWNMKEKFTRTRRSWHMLTHRNGKKTEKVKFKPSEQKMAA
ncbi:MAG: hypothetical protein LBP53_04725 [Candidatus Peribacteria bacterium]|jgi:chemotaxis protein histidine kinase CheA|nr:hypothetical protein [Candidatus Peribacteria bacterium]